MRGAWCPLIIRPKHRSAAVLMMVRAVGFLTARLHQVIDPIILEVVRGRVKTIRLRDKFHFLVIVRRPSICSNDSSFEVGMLKVDSRIVNIGFLLLSVSLLRSFSFAPLHRSIEH